jgi:hypothetical protein
VRTFSLAIVGIDYPNKRGPARRFELALCAPGEPVEVSPEPNNKHDPYAVAVYSCRGVQLGYLTAERAPWIGAQIRQGRELRAIFQGMTDKVGGRRLAFAGEAPTLPPVQPAFPAADDNGFWPDETYED